MQTKTHYCNENFDDERLLPFHAEEFEILNEVLIKMYGSPDIYFFDEPTSQLDIRHQLEIIDLVRDTVRSKKILAILVVHDLNLASRYADRIIML